jgi:uncharacterized protein (DUF169 family)
MRYDKRIELVTLTPGGYDATTGNYNEDTETAVPVFASVLPTKTDTLNLVYGSLKQDSLTCHVQNHVKQPFSYMRIDGALYRVDYSKKLQTKETFVVSKVPA